VKAFRVGFTSSLLIWATLNSLSYFVRSGGWGNLVGSQPQGIEAIGFPWTVWGEGGAYGSRFMSTAAMAGDAALAVVASLAVGLAMAWLAAKKPPGTEPQTAPPPEATRRFQFSLRTMLISTAFVAFVLSLVRSEVNALAILLLIVYLFGPSIMLVAAHLSRPVVPVDRSILLTATGLTLVAAAAVLGEIIEGIHDFTRGILGLFVCWVPQCLLMLVVMLVWQRAVQPRKEEAR
jgi:hypothetical protein